MYYLEDYSVAAAVLPLMSGMPWLIYTSFTFYATGQADLVLPRLIGATMGHPTSPKHDGLRVTTNNPHFLTLGCNSICSVCLVLFVEVQHHSTNLHDQTPVNV